MFEYFYHEIFRKTVIGFGTLFNNIFVETKDKDGNTVSRKKVPLAYAPVQKFLARIEQSSDLNKPTAINLPRMSFEITGFNYDATRKLTSTTKICGNGNEVFTPVPYNVDFELNILTKLNDDALQIVEQILPYFQPAYNITVDMVKELGDKKDVPVVLNNISTQDEYEGDFSTRRALIYTLRFTAKTYLYGPVQSSKVVKKATLTYKSGEYDPNVTKRDVVYSVTPKALKDYDGTVITTLTQDVTISDKTFTLNDASSLARLDEIQINNEVMKVISIGNDGSTISVERSQNGTTITNHVNGANVFKITHGDPGTLPLTGDDAFLDGTDDFGFNGFLQENVDV